MRSQKKNEDYAEDKEGGQRNSEMKQKKGQSQTQIVTKTLTFPSRKISTEKSTKWKLKKMIGLNT